MICCWILSEICWTSWICDTENGRSEKSRLFAATVWTMGPGAQNSMRKSMQNLGIWVFYCGKVSTGNLKTQRKMESCVIPTIGKTLIWKKTGWTAIRRFGVFFVYQNDVQLSSEQNLHPDIPKQHQAGKRLGTVKNDTKMASCRGTAAWPSPKWMEPSQATHIFVLFACVSSNSCSSTG